MSDLIVEVVAVEAQTLIVEVLAPPPAVIAVDVQAPGPPEVIEIADYGSVPIGYPALPTELRTIPITFPFGGKPPQGSPINVPMAFSVTIPTGLVGTVVYSGILATAPAGFVLNRLTGAGVVTELGRITLLPGGSMACLLTGIGGEVDAGEVIQMMPPITQDLTLADLGITVLANRE